MFEKIKKLWSSNSNINGCRRSSTKISRTKSVRNSSNLSFRETRLLPGSDGVEYRNELTTNESHDTFVTQKNLVDVSNYQSVHNTPTKEFPTVGQIPNADNVRYASLNQDKVLGVGYTNNLRYVGSMRRNNPYIGSADQLTGLVDDECVKNCKEMERLSLDGPSNINYRPSIPHKTAKTRSFGQLSNYPKQSKNAIEHEIDQLYDNKSGIYTEVVVKRNEPFLSTSEFTSNMSSPLCREKYNKYSERSHYNEIESKFARSSNCIDSYSPQRSGRISVGSSYIPSHYASTPIRSTSNMPRNNYNSPKYLHEDVFIDRNPRRTLSTARSCQRIDELEESLRDIQRKISTSTSIQMQSNIQSETQQTLISILMDKKNEADRLKEKVKKLENKLQKQQCEFAEETDKMQLETENIRHKLKLITEKFNRLEKEYRFYKDATLTNENKEQENIEDINEIKKNYEKEINSLKEKLSSISTLEDRKLNSNDDREIYLENQNTELTAKLIEKEEEILKLKEELNVYRLLKSPIDDDEYDDRSFLALNDCDDNHVTSSKSNSNIIMSKDDKSSSQQTFLSKSNLPSIYSPSSSSGFGGSQSHALLNSPIIGKGHYKGTVNSMGGSTCNNLSSFSYSNTTTSITIRPRVHRIIRDNNEIGKRLRLISKCFLEISANIIDGKDPEFHRLASRFTDSSDSDDDLDNVESNISYNSLRFEDIIRKHQVNIHKAEEFLSEVSSNVLLYTTRESDGNRNTCKIQ